MRRSQKTLTRISLLVLASLMFVGCKPYENPVYENLETSETGFLVPLEGSTSDQKAFESEAYLDQAKIAAKRVRITRRWNQTGRAWFHGEWIPNVRLIKVDRTPVTREFTTESDTGTSKRDQAIWIESKDSVGFSVGFTCTAMIQESDTAKFLYTYRSRSLAQVMDTEIRARIQSVSAEVAGKYDLDELRAQKQEIIDAVRADVVPFFDNRGITITTVGMFGGFTYENPAIQESIDNTFVAQQLKVVSAAEFDAQQKKNDRIELEARAIAEKARTIAQGEADAIRLVAEAAAAAADDPVFVTLKQLEVESQRIERWNGQYPTYMMQMGEGGGGAGLLLNLPGAPNK